MESSVVTTTSEGVIDSNVDDNLTSIGNGENGGPKVSHIDKHSTIDATESAANQCDEVQAQSELQNDDLTWEKVAAAVTADEYLTEIEEKPLESQVDGSHETPAIHMEVITENVEEITEVLGENDVEIHQESESTLPVTAQEPDSGLVDNVVEDIQPDSVMNESIEISELGDEDESVGTVEELQEVQYTVIETGDEVEDKEIHELIQEHISERATEGNELGMEIEKIDEDDNKVDEEVLLISAENENDEEEDVDEPPPKVIKPRKPRGRRPISEIPLHVLGRDISKPTGVSNGGRTMPKPRLGVKVPYRNLTSQIVSKEEIQKEIMDRFKHKQEQNATNAGDVLFARKLTQRLAKKLKPDKEAKESTSSEDTPSPSQKKKIDIAKSLIQDDSDLIAILEGDDDDVKNAEKHIESKEFAESEKFVRNIEKEIALQQLKELPITKNRIFKSRVQAEKKSPENSPITRAKMVEASSTSTKSDKRGQHLELEPQIKTEMVVKTYTRKRKSFEIDSVLPPKKTASPAVKSEEKCDDSSNPVYMTKSSRVIKKKVIWDPDEAPLTRSTIKSPPPKQGESPTKAKSATNEKKVDKSPPIIKSPGAVKPSPKKTWKRLTEVDKLLMDEGAVNMLYDVKSNEDAGHSDKRKKGKSTISLDKAHKELMSKADVIKNDLQQNTAKDSTKSLRKKDTPSPAKKEGRASPSPSKKDSLPGAVTRKKSKDSTKSSVHSPPQSPGFSYNEGSRLIRRHSSSSFSSDDLAEGEGDKVPNKRKSSNASSDQANKKKSRKNNNNVSKNTLTLVKYDFFTMTKSNRIVSIELNYDDASPFLTEDVLTELIPCFGDLEKDDDCSVVSLTSANKNGKFCCGLDYKVLIGDDADSRKKKAMRLASLVEDFLRCLLNFPKILVAGIQGECMGLGVTMLPLFDMVVASDTSTFSTPYSTLGCVAEGGFLLTTPHLSSQGLASEILYTSQVIKADDAFRRGLLTRLCWPEKYDEELKGILVKIATQSRQSLEATKAQLRDSLIETTELSLSSSSKVLIQHWTSSECQKNFANYNIAD